MTSNVIARILGRSSNGWPTGQRSVSRSVMAAMVASCRRIRSPWKKGSRSLRWRRCSGPSSISTERGPSSGSRIAFSGPVGATEGGAARMPSTSAGSLTMTIAGPNPSRRVTQSP